MPYLIIIGSGWSFLTGMGAVIFILLSIAITCAIAVVVEKIVYHPLFKNGSSEITSFIASLGLYLFIVNGIALFESHRMKILSNELRSTYDIGPLLVTDIQLIQIVVTIALLSVITIWLNSSGKKRILEAISDNPHIAKIIGLPVQSSRVIAMVIGTAFAASAGIFMGYDTGINPHSGMSIALTAIVVVLLAGKRDLHLLAIVSFTIGFLQQASSWYLSSAWADGLTFAILLVALLFRTEGVLSYQLRKDHVV